MTPQPDQDRKQSPLFTGSTPAWSDEKPRNQQEQPPNPPRAPASTPSLEGRRKRRGGEVDPFALRSFNCKMTIVMRKIVRIYAARQDVDIQDVVADAITEYLERRGQSVPRTREQYDAMRNAGDL